jgi:hypothetical protein
MSSMQVELATLNGSVISPVYSWVPTFLNYINTGGEWAEDCKSAAVANLDFDE